MTISVERHLKTQLALIATSVVGASFVAIALVIFSNPASSQQPSAAQRSAIRASCTSDYEAYCASVPPGGKPSLMCLQKNMASLSSACQKAVASVTGKSPAAAAPTTAASPPPPTASPSSSSASSSASPANAAPPADTSAKTTAKAVVGAPASNAPAAAPAQPSATTVGSAAIAPMRSLSPRQEIVLVRSSCGEDFRMRCSGVPLGGGRVVGCLRANEASLSPRCQSALMGLRR